MYCFSSNDMIKRIFYQVLLIDIYIYILSASAFDSWPPFDVLKSLPDVKKWKQFTDEKFNK